MENDKSATLQAGIVVVLSSLAAGVGALKLGASNFLLAPILSLISWSVWAYIIYFVGVKLFPDNNTIMLNPNTRHHDVGEVRNWSEIFSLTQRILVNLAIVLHTMSAIVVDDRNAIPKPKTNMFSH